MPQINLNDQDYEAYQKWQQQVEEEKRKAPSPERIRANEIVREEAYWAIGLGLIPLPMVDAVALAAVEGRMIRRIGEVYGRKFSDSYANNLFVSLLAGIGSTALGVKFVTDLLRFIPGVNVVASAVGVSVTAVPVHFAVGAWLIDSLEADPNAEPATKRFASYLRRTVSNVTTPAAAST